MSLEQGQILEICQDLWRIALGLNLDTLENPVNLEGEQSLSSYVNINGDWQGAVIVQCTESVTRHAAAMLFEVDAENVSEQDHRDALNELTRMVGKKLQKAMPAQGKLSTARSIANGDMPAALTNMRGVGQLDLACEGRPVRISLLEHVAAEAQEKASA